VSSHSCKPHILTSQSMVSQGSQRWLCCFFHSLNHKVGSGDRVSAEAGAGAWGWTTLTRKANSWMSTIRAGCALAQDTANYGVCDKYWCIVGHLTLLLRPCCVPSPSTVGAQYKRMLAFNRASRDAQWTPLCHLVRVSMLQNGSRVL
jgi:hypothetical protein